AARGLLAKAAPSAAVMAANPPEGRKKEVREGEDRKGWVAVPIAAPKPDAVLDHPEIIHRTCMPRSMMASGTRSEAPAIQPEPASRLTTPQGKQAIGTRLAGQASAEEISMVARDLA